MNFTRNQRLEQTAHATSTDVQDEHTRHINVEKAAEFVARKAQEDKP